ncbi:hypothetical protein JW613_27510 [Streptomyces smyrnaeus]|uniref:Uncharacterized protein n=1 Tax=Streptomyces smyrnaeus TaxID=1387713 RepID=A0ABS3Y359_9ACTN|nr:DUF5994 family protein [Streptomyces smyrnaeus]MBO8202014.1 hypothetical protein [Streptomyces smyrnaeus]
MTATTDRTTTDPSTTDERVSPPPVRLALTPANAPPGLLDGAWWPRSRDLFRELPTLTARLDVCWGRITRVTVNPTHWPVIPRKVPVAGHTVGVGWFSKEQDPHKLILLSYTADRGRWDLLVIPPETTAASADRLMSAAAVPGSLLTARMLMDDEHRIRDAAEDRGRTAEWDAEGGAAPPPGHSTGLRASATLER